MAKALAKMAQAATNPDLREEKHMARPLWKGSISFGLVNIPVELHVAVRDHRPRFRPLPRSAARLGQERCEQPLRHEAGRGQAQTQTTDARESSATPPVRPLAATAAS